MKKRRRDNPHRYDHLQAAYEKAQALAEQKAVASLDEMVARMKADTARRPAKEVAINKIAGLAGERKRFHE